MRIICLHIIEADISSENVKTFLSSPRQVKETAWILPGDNLKLIFKPESSDWNKNVKLRDISEHKSGGGALQVQIVVMRPPQPVLCPTYYPAILLY